MDLGSLLGALSGDESKAGENETTDAISSILGGLMGAANQGGQPAQGAPQGNSGDAVLGSLGGLDHAPMLGEAPQGGNPMGAMPAGGAGAMPADMSGLLGALLGGGGAGGAQSTDPIMGMLGGLLGGMGASDGALPQTGAGGAGGIGETMFAPLADLVAEKLHVPRETAMAAIMIIVPMVMNKLMSSQQGGGSPQGLTFTPEEQHQMVESLSQQTGLSHEQSAQALQQTVITLAGQ